jgi:hypothetical protein
MGMDRMSKMNGDADGMVTDYCIKSMRIHNG